METTQQELAYRNLRISIPGGSEYGKPVEGTYYSLPGYDIPSARVLRDACEHALRDDLPRINISKDDAAIKEDKRSAKQIQKYLVDSGIPGEIAQLMTEGLGTMTAVSVFGFIIDSGLYLAIVNRPENGKAEDPRIPYRIILAKSSKLIPWLQSRA